MKPPPFDYHAPRTTDEALALLAEHGDDARPLAGGQSLVPVLNFRLARPAVLIDLNRVQGLDGIDAREDGGLRIGAMTRQRTVERSPAVAERAPLVTRAMPHIAHPQIRDRGTFGGSLAHADPAAELPAVALALRMRFHLRSAAAERWLDAAEFFTGLFSTALRPDELLIEVEVPAPPPHAGWAFDEVARRHGDFALLGLAAAVERNDDGVCTAARLAYVNAGPGPVLAEEAAAPLVGTRLEPEAVRAAAERAAAEIRPRADVHASVDYRRQLARVLTERALRF